MSTPPTVLPVDPSAKRIEVTRVSGSIPAHVKEVMLKERAEKKTGVWPQQESLQWPPGHPASKVQPSGAPPKLPDSPPPVEDPMVGLLTKLSTTHPHTEILRLLARRSDLLRDDSRQLASQMVNIATNHNQLIQMIAQLQAMQAPIRAWMDKVAGATVTTGLTISFPQVPATEFHPLLPAPPEVEMATPAVAADVSGGPAGAAGS